MQYHLTSISSFWAGNEYELSTLHSLIVASIVEKVSGMPFADYVKENIPPTRNEKPLFEVKKDLIPNMAHGYEYEDVSNMPERILQAR